MRLVLQRERLQWGHYAALVILSALAAVHWPHFLLLVGLMRFAFCVVGGRPFLGLASALVFVIAYLGVVGPGWLAQGEGADRCEEAQNGTAVGAP